LSNEVSVKQRINLQLTDKISLV